MRHSITAIVDPHLWGDYQPVLLDLMSPLLGFQRGDEYESD